MEASVDIDVGGTFTDCVAFWGDKLSVAKAPTTPSNITAGVIRAIQQGSKSWGVH